MNGGAARIGWSIVLVLIVMMVLSAFSSAADLSGSWAWVFTSLQEVSVEVLLVVVPGIAFAGWLLLEKLGF